jgi:hypothetical protein
MCNPAEHDATIEWHRMSSMLANCGTLSGSFVFERSPFIKNPFYAKQN